MIENPILKGFCPDPSIVRVGNDYYIAVSTFEWWPGVKIFHSKDLKNWEQIKSPLRRESQLNMIGNPTSGGIWAPDLSYDNGRFYLVYTDVKTKKGRYYNNHNYLVYTDDIYGEWSESVYLNSTGFDPSLFTDTDGKKYVVNMKNGFKGILVQEYDTIHNCLIGEVKNVFLGTEIGYTEGPHMYHIGDWYYLIVAEGGTGYGHCVTMARSKSIWGPYEVDPENPMLRSEIDETQYLQKCGHADIVDTPNGEWYMVHLCARPAKGEKACVLGRETSIQKVYWNDEGWLRLSQGGFTAARYVEEPKQVEEYHCTVPKTIDDFDQEQLGVEYVSPRVPLEKNADLSARKGFLRLTGQESLNSLHHVSVVAVRQTSMLAKVELAMDFTPMHPEQLAGMVYMYDAMNFYIFGKTVNENGNAILTLIKSDTGIVVEGMECIRLENHQTLYLRAMTFSEGKKVQFYYSYDQCIWLEAGKPCETNILTDEHCRGFTGAHFGMYCHDMTGLKLFSDFDYFSYENL
jgi:xylan 1,4-beta-xylosidase